MAATKTTKPRKSAKKAIATPEPALAEAPTAAPVEVSESAVTQPNPTKASKVKAAAKSSKPSKSTKPSKAKAKSTKSTKPHAANGHATEPAREMVTMTERNPTPDVVTEAEDHDTITPVVPEVEGELEPVAAPDDNDWVNKLESSRRKPVQIDETPETLAEARSHVHVSDEPPTAHVHREPDVATTAPRSNTDLTLPEQFLLLALSDNWDDRTERIRPGTLGAAVVGSLLLDLAVRGKLKVQRDRFTIVDGPVGDADLAQVAERIKDFKELSTLEAMTRLGWRLSDRIRPWKARLQQKGLARERTWKHFGILPRSETILTDRDAQERMTKRLVRMLAGSGTPDADSVALMGLVQAAGLLPNLVPSSTMSFNSKRINALIQGRDTLHYRVDGQMAQVQQLALTTILENVRKLQGT